MAGIGLDTKYLAASSAARSNREISHTNKKVLGELQRLLAGRWVTVYRKGSGGAEVHYFEHESGKVAGVKLKVKGNNS